MAATADRLETFGIETQPMLIAVSGVHKVYRTRKLEYPAHRGVRFKPEEVIRYA
jgi:hypothetical protein